METIKLTQEYTFGAKTYKEFELNFDSLTGRDLILLENEYKERTKRSILKEQEDAWYIIVASKVLDIKYGDLLKLKAKDFVKLVMAVKVFLVGSEDETEKEETTTIEE